MPEHTGDELLSIEAQGLAVVITVVGVVEADGAAVEIERSVMRQRATRDVACQIQRDTAAMGVGLADLDVRRPPRAVILRALGRYYSVSKVTANLNLSPR